MNSLDKNNIIINLQKDHYLSKGSQITELHQKSQKGRIFKNICKDLRKLT